MMTTAEKRQRAVERRLTYAEADVSRLKGQVQALREDNARSTGQGSSGGSDDATMYCWLPSAIGPGQGNNPGSGSVVLVYRDPNNSNRFTDYGFAPVIAWNLTLGNPQGNRYGIVARDGSDYKLLTLCCLDGATAPVPAPTATDPASNYPASGLGASASNFATMGLSPMGLR